MSKKPSLAAALQSYNRAPAIPEVSPRAVRPRSDETKEKPLRALVPPSRVGKKALTCYFDPAVSKQVKQIALDRDLSIQDLLAEALNDLFQKYKKPTLA
jgi:hypothetical protein